MVDLKTLDELAAKASPGPWEEDSGDTGAADTVYHEVSDAKGKVILDSCNSEDMELDFHDDGEGGATHFDARAKANYEFICALRNAWPTIRPALDGKVVVVTFPALKLFRDQRDELAAALRSLENCATFAPLEDNHGLEAQALRSALARARAILEKVPSYEQQLDNLLKGLGITSEQLAQAIKAQA